MAGTMRTLKQLEKEQSTAPEGMVVSREIGNTGCRVIN